VILAFALLVGAALAGFAAPRFPHRMTTGRVSPSVAITSWLLATGVAATTMPAMLGLGLLAATISVSCPLLQP
jgi:hypothetical protein